MDLNLNLRWLVMDLFVTKTQRPRLPIAWSVTRVLAAVSEKTLSLTTISRSVYVILAAIWLRSHRCWNAGRKKPEGEASRVWTFSEVYTQWLLRAKLSKVLSPMAWSSLWNIGPGLFLLNHIHQSCFELKTSTEYIIPLAVALAEDLSRPASKCCMQTLRPRDVAVSNRNGVSVFIMHLLRF